MLGKHCELATLSYTPELSYLLAPSCYVASMFSVSNTLINGCPKEDQG